MTKKVLILGASGKIGRHAAQAFGRAGWQVRLFDRARDDMVAAAQGCEVIVNGLNPPNYHNWVELIPSITRQVIAAARASGAMVVIPGNVYNFGARGGALSEATPQTPCTRKGAIRVEMEQAYRDSGVQTLILRAGNFIDPERNGDVMSMLLLHAIKRGRVTAMGDPAAVQPYAYLPDWARAAVSLVEMRDRLGRFEDVPFPGHSFTVNELRSTLEAELRRDLRVSRFPWWAMRLAAPFWELARELLEMRYLWTTPHWLSDEKFSRFLPGFRLSPRREVMLAGLPSKIHPDQAVARGAGRGLGIDPVH
ncbi:epimerase [Actibacterium sp. MT2.3-13A]|uniref:epimerase n=1 Tax=Actibacterium sp. MT2.3-13A TaxID=2828332 RepID=UPI001BA68F7B|nr:epimerase [Actibacterium sp. MT2.3-13A]